MTTHRTLLLAIALAISLTYLCGPEDWRRKLAMLRYRSRLWLRMIGFVGVIWVGLAVMASEGQRLFGISAKAVNALHYTRGCLSGLLVGLIVAQLTIRHELGDQFRPEPEKPKN